QANFTQNGGNIEGSTTASAKLIANNDTKTATKYYSVSLDISKNGYIYTSGTTPELMMTVTDPSGAPITTIDGLNYTTSGGITGFDITTRKDKIIIKNNKEIVSNNYTTGLIENWTVKVYFINLNSDQQGNTSKEFKATASIYPSEKKVISNVNGVISLENSNGGYLKDYRIYGNSVQNGTPSPTVPVPLNSFGDNNINVSIKGNNLLENSNFANTNTTVWKQNQIVELSQGSDYYQVIYKQTDSTPGLIWRNAPHIFDEGKTYTISARIKGINNEFLHTIFFGKSSTVYISSNEFQDVKFTFTFNKYSENYILLYNSKPTFNSGFQIKWLKIEEGNVSTPYNETKTTVINMVGHEPLRKIGTATDYIDFENNRIVRNIKKLEFDGTEYFLNWVDKNTEQTIGVYHSNSAVLGTYGSPTFKGNGLSTHFVLGNTAYGMTDNERFSLTDGSSPPYISFRVKHKTVTEWNNYLISQKNNGTPVTVYYELVTPEYEPLELPKIKTFEGTNKITISDGTMNPSKIDISYFS
ncbi:MAG: hypothetical protein RR144_06160, partial [Clostridia bacterium]